MDELCKLSHRDLEQSPISSGNVSFEVFHLAVLPDGDSILKRLEFWSTNFGTVSLLSYTTDVLKRVGRYMHTLNSLSISLALSSTSPIHVMMPTYC